LFSSKYTSRTVVSHSKIRKKEIEEAKSQLLPHMLLMCCSFSSLTYQKKNITSLSSSSNVDSPYHFIGYSPVCITGRKIAPTNIYESLSFNSLQPMYPLSTTPYHFSFFLQPLLFGLNTGVVRVVDSKTRDVKKTWLVSSYSDEERAKLPKPILQVWT
jgi:hypothetical protein